MQEVTESPVARTAVSEPTPQSASSSSMVALIPAGIALNLVIGIVVHMIKLPVYLDAVGTVLMTILAGWRVGAIVGILSFLIGGLINPVLPYFVGTQAAIATFTYFAGKIGGFRSNIRTTLSGLLLGVVAGIVSAPVIVNIFGGITGSGTSLIAAFLLASGKTLMRSVVLSGLASEPLDKALQCLLAVWLLRGLPRGLRDRFRPDVSNTVGVDR
jgi:energy-coupling factor transport system substrate-specific component